MRPLFEFRPSFQCEFEFSEGTRVRVKTSSTVHTDNITQSIRISTQSTTQMICYQVSDLDSGTLGTDTCTVTLALESSLELFILAFILGFGEGAIRGTSAAADGVAGGETNTAGDKGEGEGERGAAEAEADAEPKEAG